MKKYMVIIEEVKGTGDKLLYPERVFFFDTEEEAVECQYDHPLDNGETYARTELSPYHIVWRW